MFTATYGLDLSGTIRVLAGFGAGSLVGEALFRGVGRRTPRRALMMVALMVAAGAMLLLAANRAWIVSAGAIVVLGIASGLLNPILGTFRQYHPQSGSGRRTFAFMPALTSVLLPHGIDAISALALVATPFALVLATNRLIGNGWENVLQICGGCFAVLALVLLAVPSLKE